jgi:4-hydroxy-tetrahydrodipicolinate synthase
MSSQLNPAPFGRVITAMVTPFGPDGSLDVDGAATLARWLVEHGSDGLVLAGTTGESPTLTDDEKIALFEAVRDAVDVALIAGVGSNDTRHDCALAERAAGTGVDALLAVTPYYSKPAQSGLAAHLRALATTTDLPVMLYDVPGRTGTRLSHDVLLGLAELDTVVAYKDATGDLSAAARLVAEVDGALVVYSGDDAMTLPLLVLGAVGLVGVSTHWTARWFQDLVAAVDAGDLRRARATHARLRSSFEFANTERSPYSVSTKAMLRTLGLPAGECRLPLGPAPEGVEDHARAVWADLGRQPAPA